MLGASVQIPGWATKISHARMCGSPPLPLHKRISSDLVFIFALLCDQDNDLFFLVKIF